MSNPQRGKRTQLPLIDFLISILETNEEVPKHKKRTDSQILALLQDEFPNSAGVRSMVLRSRGKGSPTSASVNQYRNKFNRGELTRSIPPFLSFRYSEDGFPVNGRTGKRYLTSLEINALIAQHQARISAIRNAINNRAKNIRYNAKRKKKSLLCDS